MVSSEDAITYIKDKLILLVNSGRLVATYNQSRTTISFYVNDIETAKRPLVTLSLRLSDHNPKLQHNIEGNVIPSPESNTNISIEFYQPMYDSSGKRKRNRFDTRVKTNDDEIILPFEVTNYDYAPELLDYSDLDLIYKATIDWIFNNTPYSSYVDPFKGTPKEAKTNTKTAKISTNFTTYAQYRNSIRYQQNYNDGWKNATQAEINWWKNKGIDEGQKKSKNTILIKESQLRSIIRNVIMEILS